MRKDSNLSNKDSNPANATVEMSVSVHFDQYRGPFPKAKFQEWLAALPDNAKIEFTGVKSGLPHFKASWKEQR